MNHFRCSCSMVLASCLIFFLIFPLVLTVSSVTAFTLHSSALSNLNNKLYLENSDDPSEPLGFGLYVHIPYCRRRCRYCNFAIVPIGTKIEIDTNHKYSEQEPQSIGFQRMNQNYTAALLKELYSIRKQQDSTRKERLCLKSIYFGGGTPSLMPTESLRRIMSAIYSVFDVNRYQCEISMEVDPGTFTLEKLRDWKELGVNRLSLGVQSFDDTLLESLGRVHRSKDIFESLEMIRQVYGDDVNYSIDLISGLPGLSTALWMETLQIATTALNPRPKHLSVYDLQIEQGTVFGNLYGDADDEDEEKEDRAARSTIPDVSLSAKLRLRLLSSRESAFMYKYTAGYLRHKNYEHYEISSYAALPTSESGSSMRTGPSPYRSQHNQMYWGYDSQWYAIGLGASSFVANVTVARPRAMSDYLKWVEGAIFSLPDRDNILDDLESLILKRLRTSDGLSFKRIRERYGIAFVGAIRKGFQVGCDLKMVSIDDQQDIVRLNDPSGFLFSNSIISNIFYELEAVDKGQRSMKIKNT